MIYNRRKASSFYFLAFFRRLTSLRVWQVVGGWVHYGNIKIDFLVGNFVGSAGNFVGILVGNFVGMG